MTPIKNSQATYDSFAEFYDFAMGDRKEIAVAIELLIQNYHPKAKSILELGCGSGSLLKILSKKYSCRGVDLSPSMIKQAEKKVPHVPVSVGDIAEVSFGERYDLVLCAFDTINHILDFARWKKVFEVAKKHLKPNGIFIFDINTERKLARYTEEPPFAEFDGDATATFEVTRKGKNRFLIQVQVFAPTRNLSKDTPLYAKKTLTLEEATFPIPQIKTALQRNFKKIRMLDPERDRVSSQTEELYFVCSQS